MPSDDEDTTLGTDTVSSQQVTQAVTDMMAHMDAMEDRLMKELQKGMAFASETAVVDIVKRVRDTRERAAVADAAVQATGGSNHTNAIPVPSTTPAEATDSETEMTTEPETTGGLHYDPEQYISARVFFVEGADLKRTENVRVPLYKAAKWRSLGEYLSKATEGVHQEAARAGCVCSAGRIVLAVGGESSGPVASRRRSLERGIREIGFGPGCRAGTRVRQRSSWRYKSSDGRSRVGAEKAICLSSEHGRNERR